ncbi:Non-specific serine/threonine protein kinase [Sulfidibacter corallicola]|uniref:Protein kinase n=1 Tax=Sulfidibacter corallicola TaxID=2818388 RepID=A0A8A4U3B6_SULCO|nr:serine/threonine-protein kinase [Sulfidibacter corallicola]QTD53235.1 protein kinase [Sulfidibacter corallicola]
MSVIQKWRTEIEFAIAENLINPDEADHLLERARRADRSPLDLLMEIGALSDETLNRLNDKARTISRLTPYHSDLPPSRKGSSHEFPVANWDRYQPERFLGEGGMGKVFLAYDPRLQRRVAIKFVHEGREEDARRLIREARSQARVQHERVCKVFEVNEIDSQVYIAMEYIDGRSMTDQAVDLTTRELVEVVREAALGVHAAHEVGLIHRDLKPSNIMLAKSESGAWKPYVVDFGLAFDWGEDSTQMWAAGTPHFMAPEQALGQEGCLDPRTDVYSLGATLYWCLCGKPPIQGSNALETLARIPQDDPVAPHLHNPRVSKDLELITLKCLRKNRAARYPSALALAKDLDCYLRGDAVSVRAADWSYLVAKKIRKHRVFATMLVTTLLLMIGAGIWNWNLSQRAALREDFVRRFAEQAEEIEAMVRFTYMLPLHDIRVEREEIQNRFSTIKQTMETAGPLASEAGNYALGRSHSALGEYHRARSYLEIAWDQGFREPRVAYSLAQTLGALYHEALTEVSKIKDPELRLAREKELRTQYRDRVLDLLKLVPTEGARFPEYLEAMIAFYEQDWENAQELLVASRRKAPWFFESYLLEGRILLARARQAEIKGHPEQTRSFFQRARQSYREALKIAPSNPEIYFALADLNAIQTNFVNYHGGATDALVEEGNLAIDNALIANPDSYPAMVRRVNLDSVALQNRINRSEDVTEDLAKALALARRAQSFNPRDPRLLKVLGKLHLQRALGRREKTLDPSRDLAAVWAIYGRIPEGHRDHAYYVTLGLAHKIAADHLAQNGEDSLSQRDAAIRSYRQAISLDPHNLQGKVNLGLEMLSRADLVTDSELETNLRETATVFREVLAQNPEHMLGHYFLATCLERLGTLYGEWDLDPEGEFMEALCHYERAEEIQPRVPNFPQGQAITWHLLAKDRWSRGLPYESFIQKAEEACERAIQINPGFGHAHNSMAVTLFWAANAQIKRGQNPGQKIQRALSTLDTAEEILPNLPQIHLTRAAALEVRGKALVDRNRSAETTLRQALASIDRALEEQPDNFAFHGVKGSILLWTGIDRIQRGKSATSVLLQADHSFQVALQSHPFHRPSLIGRSWTWLYLISDLRRRAERSEDPAHTIAIEEAAHVIDTLAVAMPDHPDILAIRALYHGIRQERDDVKKGDWAQEGRELWNRALARNNWPHHYWKKQRARLKIDP